MHTSRVNSQAYTAPLLCWSRLVYLRSLNMPAPLCRRAHGFAVRTTVPHRDFGTPLIPLTTPPFPQAPALPSPDIVPHTDCLIAFDFSPQARAPTVSFAPSPPSPRGDSSAVGVRASDVDRARIGKSLLGCVIAPPAFRGKESHTGLVAIDVSHAHSLCLVVTFFVLSFAPVRPGTPPSGRSRPPMSRETGAQVDGLFCCVSERRLELVVAGACLSRRRKGGCRCFPSRRAFSPPRALTC